jgi:DNA-binding HxlR family transcriptional regulator
MTRTYHQHCAVARALDLVGERWTLLVIRELLLGPRRYRDLLAGLPGIGTNLLAARLRELGSAGIVHRRVLPPPAGSTVYELTELGAGLRPALLELGRWGAHLLAEPRPMDELRAGWYVVSMLATARTELAEGVDRTYELRVDGDVFRVRLRGGAVDAGPPGPDDPDLTVTTALESFLALLAGELDPSEALDRDLVELEGDPQELHRFVAIFRWPAPDLR